ncbi:MAG: flagellar motor switch protein FliN [Gammaproteobacteria bacterium]|nr:flagellar motor switch protein FliN [Gammaproteobacteria bacterium]
MSDDVENQGTDNEWTDATDAQAESDGNADEPRPDPVTDSGEVQQAAMNNLVDDSGSKDSSVELEAILDIPVSLSVRIGETRINIRNLLQLNQGSVVELDRLAGEPLDVLVNDTLVAHGEVVVVNEKYGIRLTDVVSAHERVKKLQ